MHSRGLAHFSSALPGWDVERTLEAAAAVGLGAVEWGAGQGQALGVRDDGPAIRDRCLQAGLEVCGLSVQDTEATIERFEVCLPYVELAAVIGAPQVRFMAPPYRGGSLEREQQAVRDGLARLVDRAGTGGLRILVETSHETLAPSPELLVALVDGFPADRVGALYDPGNMVVEGHVSPALAIARLGAYLHHVHVKNLTWARSSGRWRWRYARLDAGLLDWQEIMRQLAKAGYTGRFSIDHLGGRPTLALLRSEMERLRALVSSAS